MRVSYTPPGVNQFDIIFKPQSISISGGGLNDIKVFKPYYRGGSLFGILGSIIKRSLPFLKNFILPEAGNFVKNIANDMNNNIPLRKNIKRNFIRSASNVGKTIIQGGKKIRKVLRGKSKRKNNTKKKTIKKNNKKRKCNIKKRDVFSMNKLDF